MVKQDYETEGIQLLIRWLQKGINLLVKAAERLEFYLYRKEFGERDDDIYIVTYPKSGTTMMQMILYQLTTDGDLSFKHIYDVSPWIRNASFRKQKPKEYPSPRLIKSHDRYSLFPKKVKGRFIFIFRDGMDVALSLYHQNKNYNRPDLRFEDAITKFLSDRKNGWFQFTKQWFENKCHHPILHLRYEDLINQKETEIRKIIAFCNLKSTPDHIERALKYSSFEFMKAEEDKFGIQPPTPKVHDQFIRRGKIGEGEKHFSAAQTEKFTHLYKHIVLPSESKVYPASKPLV